jgi:hypothetical protein
VLHEYILGSEVVPEYSGENLYGRSGAWTHTRPLPFSD